MGNTVTLPLPGFEHGTGNWQPCAVVPRAFRSCVPTSRQANE
ncbi:hypothetical protein E2C01_089419 [Portunus trituberculatus]|uniref:Uncharacterized protein n=1 Tax=Portunus trituberculatus TaxID=210409 RepID=A0A5B7JMC0_PORTR|nr:hypothetical protein [Portunus trituberculatus]